MSSPVDRSIARQKRREGKRRKDGPLLKLVQEQAARRPVRPSRQPIVPLTEAQVLYKAAIFANRVTFGIGPAGTGKTWLAAALAAEQLLAGNIERIVVTRPAIEAGEALGFMPGDLAEKYEPYFRPVRDALQERLGAGHLEYLLKNGTIEARPLAFLRGATLKGCWVIGDEMQNTTPAQMKMFLTRIGEGATFIVNGDPGQKDIPGPSGLNDAVKRLKGVPHISVVEFSHADIVRDAMCQAIASAYEQAPE